MRFRRGHVSGRFDEEVPAWRAAVRRYALECQALAVTEVDRNTRAHVLALTGWHATYGDKGPRDDCAVTVARSMFPRVTHEETHTLSHRRYITERNTRADTTEAAFQVARTDAGEQVLNGSVHTPHEHLLLAEQLRSGHVHTDVGLAYVDIVGGYFERAAELALEHHVTRLALSGDWNLDFRQAWVRQWFRKHHPGWSLNWDAGLPKDGGTHGREVIDATFLRGLQVVGRPRLLTRDPRDDHRGYVETLAG